VKHTISALVANRSGVLAEMAEEFKRRGLNIRSISSGETENPDVSRMVICFDAPEPAAPDGCECAAATPPDGIVERVARMDFVIQVDDLSRREFVDRELVLMKIRRENESLSQLMQILEVFRAGVVGLGEHSVTVELSGDSERVEGLIRMMTPFGILSMARTGKIALKRGDEA
jgi:acetolactate synthase-1/3 small subunit